MDVIQDYFLCDSCQNKDFKRIYNFSIRLHDVNFADELIYDEMTDVIYQCTQCNKTFTKEEVGEALNKKKKVHKGKD